MKSFACKTDYGKCPLCKTDIRAVMCSFVGALTCSNIGCLIFLGRFTKDQLSHSYQIREVADHTLSAKSYDEGTEKSPWIDVRDRKPIHLDTVDVWVKDYGRISDVEFNFGRFFFPTPNKVIKAVSNVTHYMHVPNLPITEQNQ